MLFSNPFPTEGDFFSLYQKSAEQALLAAKEFKKISRAPSQSEHSIQRIKEIEKTAGEITHETMKLLHKTFITPFDREYIQSLALALDKVTDGFDALAARIGYFELKELPSVVPPLADLCLNAAIFMQHAVQNLHTINKPESLFALCDSIHQVENEADELVRAALSDLFKNEEDPRLLIQHKEIFEWLETTADRLENVASTIQMIILEST